MGALQANLPAAECLAEGEERGPNLLRLAHSNRGCSGGSSASFRRSAATRRLEDPIWPVPDGWRDTFPKPSSAQRGGRRFGGGRVPAYFTPSVGGIIVVVVVTPHGVSVIASRRDFLPQVVVSSNRVEEHGWIHGLAGLYHSRSRLVFSICMQQSRRAAMALRQLLAAAPGGTAHPDIYPRKCMHRYGRHTKPWSICIVIRISIRIAVRESR